MIDPVNIIVLLFFLLVVIVPFVVYLVTSYEAPPSFKASLRSVAALVLVTGAVHMVYGYFSQGVWDWGFLGAIAVAAPVMLGVDWLVLRSGRSRETS
jgi:hypothetical protein